MNQEFPSPATPEESTEEMSLHEIAYVWSEKIRNQKYKDLFGEFPDPSLTEEHIASVILYPEKREAEELEKIERNRKVAKDTIDYYPRKIS